MKTLSIRQPWAWLIVNGYKMVENRSRSLGFPRQTLLIHASSRMTRSDYDACVLFIRANEALRHIIDVLPAFDDLQLGGIVGQARIDFMLRPGAICAADSALSNWYTGEVGYVMRNPKPLPFKHYKGRLGFFDVDYEGLPA